MNDFTGLLLFFSLTELYSDMMLALKIFALLTVVSFVYMHLGKGPLSYALIGGISWFVLFDYWKFFGGVFLLYSLLTLGISGILIDFFFVTGMGGGGEEPSPVDSSMDLMMRQKQLARAQQMQARAGAGPAAQAPAGAHLGARAGAARPGPAAKPRGPG